MVIARVCWGRESCLRDISLAMVMGSMQEHDLLCRWVGTIEGREP